VTAVVVGGGLAGAAAALALAEAGIATALVRAGPGATAMSWGSLDVAAASPDPDGLPWRDPVRGDPLRPSERLAFLLRSRPAHPFGALFPERQPETAARELAQAAADLDRWLRPSGLGVEGSLEDNALLANVRGAVRVTDLALSGFASGDLSRAEGVALVDVPGLAGWHARAAARMLAAELAALGLPAPPIRIEGLAWPEGLLEVAANPARLAAALDDPAAVSELARAARALRGELRSVLFPPVLGLDRGAAARDALREAIAAPVAELLGAPPWSPAGTRLDRALLAALSRAGVTLHAARAARIDHDGERARGVELEPDGEGAARALPAACVVLATGRFVGGGLVERDERLLEPLAGLPVFDERGHRLDGDAPRRHLRRRYADPQPLFAAGVRVDGRLRPLAADGRPALANLFAAGELIGGFDPALQRTGLGFALVSGRRAGAEAARAARLAP
jgi:glycerol-3-phosphate dehydrogenase subunit B